MLEQNGDFSSREEEQNFDLLIKKISSLINFNSGSYKKSHLKRRIDVRLRATRSKTYIEYLNYLTKNPSEKGFLFETLAVNVTNFFRNPDCFKAIKEEVLPYIFAFKDEKKQKNVRIWSAGASSGEEIYSIAILLKELLGSALANYEISLVGTDIDEDALNKARVGVYKEQQLRETDPLFIKKYFKKSEKGDYAISDEIKKMVSFSVHDLISGSKLSIFDIILCRNVVIYFNKETQNDLFEKFYDSLSQNGFLIIGSSEVMPTELSKKFSIANAAERVYQKV